MGFFCRRDSHKTTGKLYSGEKSTPIA